MTPQEISAHIVTLGGQAEELEAFAVRTMRTTAIARGVDLDSVMTTEVIGAAVRLRRAGGLGHASTANITPAGLAMLVEDARIAARHCVFEPGGFAAERPCDTATAMATPEPDVSACTHATQTVCDIARHAGPNILGVRRAMVSQTVRTVSLTTTAGFSCASSTRWTNASVTVIAETARRAVSAMGSMAGLSLGDDDFARIAREAAADAERLLKPSGVWPKSGGLVFSALATAKVLRALVAAFLADRSGRPGARWVEEGNDRFAARDLRLIDDGTSPDAPGGSPFDDEGTARRRTILLAGGAAPGLLHTRSTAARAGVQPSGNAYRSDYREPPAPASNNLFLDGTTQPDQELMRAANDLVYLQDISSPVAGMIAADGRLRITGPGLLIADGQVSAPLSSVSVDGSINDLLRSVRALGNSSRLFLLGGFVAGVRMLSDLPVSKM